jgi:hypothetical protein
VLGGVSGGLVSCVALIHIGQLDALAGGLLRRLSETAYLLAILFVGRGDVGGEQVPERVHGNVELGAPLALGAVVAGTRPALGAGAQGAAVEDHRRGRRLAAGDLAQQRAQVVDHALEHPRPEPAARLLVDDLPRGQVVGQHAPGRARADHIAKRVEHLAQIVPALAGIEGQQREIGRHERPLLVPHIGPVRLAGSHPHHVGPTQGP